MYIFGNCHCLEGTLNSLDGMRTEKRRSLRTESWGHLNVGRDEEKLMHETVGATSGREGGPKHRTKGRRCFRKEGSAQL